MPISSINNNYMFSEDVENTTEPIEEEVTTRFEEKILQQEIQNTTKSLPDIFTLANTKAVNSKFEEPFGTTKEVVQYWFKAGVARGATHLIVVCDLFSYDDFPVYLYLGDNPQKEVNFWNNEELYSVMEVYALHIDMNLQLNEHRSWHLETA